jgi:hypothetical protein
LVRSEADDNARGSNVLRRGTLFGSWLRVRMISQNNIILLTAMLVLSKSASNWSYLFIREFFKNVWQAAQKVGFANVIVQLKLKLDYNVKDIVAKLAKDDGGRYFGKLNFRQSQTLPNL